MDVSNREEPGGQELIEKVISLTGLPEQLAQNELDQILEFSGQSSGGLTLEQLRQAMLTYLEALQHEFEQGEKNSEENPDDQSGDPALRTPGLTQR